MRQTWFDGAHGELDITGLELLQLFVLSVFGVTLTAGLAFPWVATYALGFFTSRLRLVGPIAFEHIRRAESEGDADAVADGVAVALDVGLAL